MTGSPIATIFWRISEIMETAFFIYFTFLAFKNVPTLICCTCDRLVSSSLLLLLTYVLIMYHLYYQLPI